MIKKIIAILAIVITLAVGGMDFYYNYNNPEPKDEEQTENINEDPVQDEASPSIESTNNQSGN